MMDASAMVARPRRQSACVWSPGGERGGNGDACPNRRRKNFAAAAIRKRTSGEQLLPELVLPLQPDDCHDGRTSSINDTSNSGGGSNELAPREAG